MSLFCITCWVFCFFGSPWCDLLPVIAKGSLCCESAKAGKGSFRISHESKQVTLSLTAMPGATVDSLHSLEAMVEGLWLYR